MTCNPPDLLKSDAPIKSADEDRLGFKAIATRIAKSVMANGSQDGLTVGIYGPWGSGKSSLLAMVRNELLSLPEPDRPSIITFSPWLIGNRDALIANLLSDITKEIALAEWRQGDATGITKQGINKALTSLEAFLKGISKAGSAVEVVGSLTGWAPLEYGGKMIKALDVKRDNDPSIATLKANVETSLRELSHRFVVTIDDVDRLDPGEATEVLRLVRSVANLPNVNYLLCYDPRILACAIEETLKIKDGSSYLEKIIHLPIGVPQPEEMQLRNWFAQELNGIAKAKDDDEASRLRMAIDQEGNRHLQTPRAVQRTLNSIRFLWPAIRDARADLADLVWLQLIKERNPSLHRWIEKYCATAAMVALSAARVEDTEASSLLEELSAAVGDRRFNDPMTRYLFGEMLAGIETDIDGNIGKFKLFTLHRNSAITRAIKKKRLSSPDHYRLYFALDAPSFAPTDETLRTVAASSERNSESIGSELLALHSQTVAGSLTKAEVLLDRLRDEKYLHLSEKQRANLAKSLADTMDEARAIKIFDEYLVETIWDKAERLLQQLLCGLPAEQRASTVEYISRKGRAFGWLTSLYRRETFAHGKFGERPQPSSEWIFTDAEYEVFSSAMKERYRNLSHAEWSKHPSPIRLLFAWHQGGDPEGARSFVQTAIKSDKGLIETLEQMFSVVHRGDGTYQTLPPENVRDFADYEACRDRVSALETDLVLGVRARALSEAFRRGGDRARSG